MPAMATISRAVIAPRSQGLSSGAIAGAVVGSLLGGGILLVVLGFLYNRYTNRNRKSSSDLDDGPPLDLSTYDPEQAGSSLGLGDSHQKPSSYAGDGVPNGANPNRPAVRSTGGSPITPRGVDWMEDSQDYTDPVLGYDAQPQDNGTLPPGLDFSMEPVHQTFPVAAKRPVPASFDHASTAAPEAANSSYYDTRISMGSNPEHTVVLPSEQMSELYKAQQREAEEHRRSSSLHKRIWNTITRQSTRNSKGTVSDGAQSPSIQQQYADSSFTAYPPIKQEDGQITPGRAWVGISPEYVEEPEEIVDVAPTPAPHGPSSGQGSEELLETHYGRYGRQTQDSQSGGFPSRIDSSIRETTEKDPALPSSVLTTDSTYGLPLAAQPLDTTEHRERLKSPEIPEPMELDGLQPESDGHSPFRSSHSPQLSPPESFTINPMAILHPSNPTEQAAYTTYQIKHSASPPAMPPSAPKIITREPTQVETVESSPAKEDDFADMYLDLPSDDEVRRSSDSYDYSSTPGQSSMAESMGRTPDTRPTVSPSPFPSIPEHGKLKPDLSISPNPSKSSPQSGSLVCPECGRAFDQIHKLNHHKRYHDRTHECPYPDCERKFGTKTHLDRHINDRHLKLKAYHCTEPTCAWFKGGKSFPRKDNWRRHMIKKHGSTQQDFDNMEMAFG